jgi:hypothetical protein
MPSDELDIDNEPQVVQPSRPMGDRFIDKLTTSAYLIPIILIGGSILYFGLRLMFLVALVVGCIVWSYWGRKMETRDAKLALVVDIEGGTVAPLIIGRKRWATAVKVGRPYLAFRTPSGLSVEVIKEYKAELNQVIYPTTGTFSDVYIASIPSRYGELIDELVRLSKENMHSKTEVELEALKKTRAHNAILSEMMNDLLVPKKGGNK